jgi:hypothetical protein
MSVLSEGRSECGEFLDEQAITLTLRVRAQKSAVLTYFAAEADFSETESRSLLKSD